MRQSYKLYVSSLSIPYKNIPPYQRNIKSSLYRELVTWIVLVRFIKPRRADLGSIYRGFVSSGDSHYRRTTVLYIARKQFQTLGVDFQMMLIVWARKIRAPFKFQEISRRYL